MTLSKRLSQLQPDIRVECLAAMMMKAGTLLENIIVSPQGQFLRGHQQDVLKRQSGEEFGTEAHLEYLLISRDGLYDYLPEGLFHQYHSLADDDNNAALRRLQQNRQTEQAARRFFLALEREFYRLRIMLELQENASLQLFHNKRFSDVFAAFWQFPEQLHPDEQQLFYLLPLCRQIVGDEQQLRRALQLILNVEVNITRTTAAPLTADASLTRGIGAAVLGEEILPGISIYDGMPALLICVGPLSKEDILRFLPGSHGIKILKMLCDMLVPLDMELEIDISISAGVGCVLDESDAACGRLGYSTIVT